MLENLRHTFADQKLLAGPCSATDQPERKLRTSVRICFFTSRKLDVIFTNAVMCMQNACL